LHQQGDAGGGSAILWVTLFVASDRSAISGGCAESSPHDGPTRGLSAKGWPTTAKLVSRSVLAPAMAAARVADGIHTSAPRAGRLRLVLWH